MKKKLALLLSASMLLGSLPMTVFAATTNTINRIVTGTTDTKYNENGSNSIDGTPNLVAPVLTFKEKDLEKAGATTTVTFKATLENTEWNITGDPKTGVPTNISATYGAGAEVTVLSSKQAIFTLPVNGAGMAGAYVDMPLEVKLTDEGDGKITIDPLSSVLTGGTYKFATIVGGSTSTTVGDTVNIVEGGTELKTLIITEAAAGSLESTTANSPLKVKLTSGFAFKDKVPTVALYNDNDFDVPTSTEMPGDAKPTSNPKVYYKYSSDGEEVYFYLKVKGGDTKEAATISISGLDVKYDDSDVSVGDECEVTVSGANLDKQSVLVGKATTYSVSWEAENKTLPTLYSGRADEDVDTLEVTLKEIIGDSWLVGRKTTITFPEGIKVMDVDITKSENFQVQPKFNVEDNVITIEDGELKIETGNKHKKARIDMKFTLSVAPDFKGDVVATLGGAGVESDMEATVATVVPPVVVEAETNSVSIDYRNVAISDIFIKESFAGALEKDKVLQLELDQIKFDGTPKVEVVEGDLKIERIDTEDGKLQIKVKSASSKTASKIKISDIQLYLERNLPAGKYELKLSAYDPFTGTKGELGKDNYGQGISGDANERFTGSAAVRDDAYFQTSVAKNEKYKKTIYFDDRDVTVLEDFVEVVTAGRDQDDGTFTTKIVVQVGANTMTAGKETINLDVPAYISNGYTMLPVRAVTEALSSVAIVRWDDPSHTVTITFGSRVISMKVGSNIMTINGVEVAMAAACEITDERAFIPLRDLGYALGLNDSKIQWDDATKTATLN